MRRWREPLVEHQIHEHACDRDIKPDRDRPARDPRVPVPSATKDRNEGQNDQRQSHKGKENVRSEHGKVNRSEPAGVSGRVLADAGVVSDGANQKAERGDQGRDHAHHMAAPRAAPDEVPARRNEDGTHQIERGVKSRQIGG